MASRTDLADFLLDCLDLAECKLREAQNDPASQKAAVTEAGGAFPLMAMRLREEDPRKFGSWALVAEHLDNTQWWGKLANMKQDEFLQEVRALSQNLALLRDIFKS
jgi:hypothetical protein